MDPKGLQPGERVDPEIISTNNNDLKPPIAGNSKWLRGFYRFQKSIRLLISQHLNAGFYLKPQVLPIGRERPQDKRYPLTDLNSSIIKDFKIS